MWFLSGSFFAQFIHLSIQQNALPDPLYPQPSPIYQGIDSQTCALSQCNYQFSLRYLLIGAC